MRKEPEYEVFLAFNDQIAIVAENTEITEEAVNLKEIKKEENQKELPSSITKASGYPKAEKLDWFVEKSTELGAQA
ncbi:16S rRNA (uracil(1498)-N(3))-methyltransferase, partial [Enterococcus faecium]